MKEVETEHGPVVLGAVDMGMDVVEDGLGYGYPSNLGPSLNSEDNACKQR